jgi:acyl carrier protein
MTEVDEIVRVVSQLAARQLAPGERFKIDDPGVVLGSLGLKSLQTVALMVDVEDAFEIEFPPEMVNEITFRSVHSIADAVRALQLGGRSGP